MVGVAGFISTAFLRPRALSSIAGHQRVADVAHRTSADRAALTGPIVARGTVSSASAGVGVAQIGFSECPTALKGVAREATWARTDGLVVLHLAVGTSSAGAYTRVHALQLEAGLVTAAVVVGCALSEAAVLSISLEELWAGAGDSVVANIAVGTLSAGVVGARVDTAVIPTGAVTRAVSVGDALSPTSSIERVADVVGDAGADGAVVLNAAVGVGGARAWLAQLLRIETSAGREWISCEAVTAGADRLVVSDCAFGGAGADVGDVTGVDALLALAGLAAVTVAGLEALGTDTSVAGVERVALVTVGAAAHGASVTLLALGIPSAGAGEAGVGGGCRGCGAVLDHDLGTVYVSVAVVSVRARADSPVVATIAVGVEATSSRDADALTLGLATAVVVGALEVADTLRLAAVDGVSVGHEVVEALALCNAAGIDVAAGVGAAWGGTAWVGVR